jgi:hypothetical protein
MAGIENRASFRKLFWTLHIFPLSKECIFCLLPSMAEKLENALRNVDVRNPNALNITTCQMTNSVNVRNYYIQHLSSY